MSYAFTFQSTPYTPSGILRDSHGAPLPVSEVDAYNRSVEQQELAWLQTRPAHAFLYVRLPGHVLPFEHCGPSIATELDRPAITTFLGTVVASHVHIGPRRHIGFDKWTYRRHVTCRLFGAVYHGWYMESSGDYCRLRRAKV